MSSDVPNAGSFGRALLVMFGVLLLAVVIGAISGFVSVAVPLWFIWLFFSRRWWLEPFVDGIYRGGWTRVFLWPFSMGDKESCTASLRALTYLFPVMGVLLLVVDINLRAAPM
jgi:hypothetical protein